ATGLRMRERNLVLQVLRCVYDRPALSDWDEDETKKAFRMAKQVGELLEDPEHCGTHARQGASSERDYRGDPAVIAVPTALAAVLALRHGGDAAEARQHADHEAVENSDQHESRRLHRQQGLLHDLVAPGEY
ncbi:MAG: hypothetical protein M1823_007772, partial [Watsoniomyces obsoletus]